jgi:hypothetical protein
MPNLFGRNIAKIVADSIAKAGGVLDATLIASIQGTRTPGQLTGGTNPTGPTYAGKGFVEEVDSSRFSESLLERGTKQVVLLGHTFAAVPEANDQITIEGETLMIIGVLRDPAGATYTCLCSG